MTLLIALAAAILTLTVSPQKGFEPLDIKTRIHLVPSDANRAICVVVSNLDTGAEISSCRTLDGANEPAATERSFRGCRVGHYAVTVRVERHMAVGPVEVLEVVRWVEVMGPSN